MSNPTAAMVVIGDEIIMGRTQDVNVKYLAQELTLVGIDLKEVRIVGDLTNDIVLAVNSLRENYRYVFTSGGIGPTHDDITSDAIAKAFCVSIDIRADALAILKSYYEKTNTELNSARLRMARIPESATLINNSISGAPGFKIGNVLVMAGVPKIFQSMLRDVLPSLVYGTPIKSESIRVETPEGELAQLLKNFAASFPDLAFASYPFREIGLLGTNIVIRGKKQTKIDTAKYKLLKKLNQ